jgi:hypothetical protein
MRSSHNTSDRLTQCLHDAGINHHDLLSFIILALEHRPKPKNLQEAIHYKMLSIQAERLTLLIAA